MASWKPLLTGELAQRARQVLDEIAGALAPPPAAPDATGEGRATDATAQGSQPGAEGQAPEEIAQDRAPVATAGGPQPGDEGRATDASAEGRATDATSRDPQPDDALPGPSLAGGTAGAALFFAYRVQSGLGSAEDAEAAATLLERSTEALATTPLTPDLYGGFTGVAWTAEHLYGPRFAEEQAPGAEPIAGTAAAPADSVGAADAESAAVALGADDEDAEDEDPLADIDAALLRFLERTPWTADYDLIRGLAGFGVYALERLPRHSALLCLSRIVDRLSETAEQGPQGTTWHTAPELLPDWQRKLFPQGYYNLGMAHGVPAVIALLAAAAAAADRLAPSATDSAADPDPRVLAARARALREGATRWLLAQRLPAGEPCWFGTTFSPETPPQRSRLAWCYGDPGVAAAMLVAARASGDVELEKAALEVALLAAARPADAAGVRDAGLCHGSAGLGHLFNRLYQETGEPQLADASRRWFQAALEFRQPGVGLAGYRAFTMDDAGIQEGWRDDGGLLEGVAGIGLALLGALSDFEPAWDRVLMLSALTSPPPPPAAARPGE